jgi:hypothetical protein
MRTLRVCEKIAEIVIRGMKDWRIKEITDIEALQHVLHEILLG